LTNSEFDISIPIIYCCNTSYSGNRVSAKEMLCHIWSFM